MDSIKLLDFSGVQELTEIERIRRRQNTSRSTANPDRSGDTVSFSEEALQLAAAMKEQESAENSTRQQGAAATKNRSLTSSANFLSSAAAMLTQPDKGGIDQTGTKQTAGKADSTKVAQGGGSGGGAQAAEQSPTEGIKAKIAALQERLSSILGGEGSPEIKEAKAAPIRAQIAALTQEMNALQAATAQTE